MMLDGHIYWGAHGRFVHLKSESSSLNFVTIDTGISFVAIVKTMLLYHYLFAQRLIIIKCVYHIIYIDGQTVVNPKLEFVRSPF